MLSQNWKEFMVMRFQWDALYYPLLWSLYIIVLSLLLVPKTIISFSRRQLSTCGMNFNNNRELVNNVRWIMTELYSVQWVWVGMIGYLFYLILCPWLCGQGLAEGEKGYMTYRGWAFKFLTKENIQFVGFPDVMVVVIPHLYVVVLPTCLVIGALVVEAGVHRDSMRFLSGKKEDDFDSKKGSNALPHSVRWIRKVLMLICLTICCVHFLSCRVLSKAYEMNVFIHFPIYSISVPWLLVFAIYRTRKI
ncbi:unnamed protein product [Cuscuta europaea]|uniref:TMEM62 C-terminal domain-containing protein n=1 Tax=Cuscuta europaea TaxID=41803 RepID=A0A9P0YGD5_CUSEU|nr:unnamed protein product [Cuscuta europaea]